MTFFTAGDFAEQEWQPISSAQAANIANAKLAREAKVVYSYFDNTNRVSAHWHSHLYGVYTHRALLICVEEIERKPCEHVPTYPDLAYSKCKKCGVKLKAKWEVVE